jgi:tRNA nucleotidyltransferase/poly(A) polymerase
VGGCVRKALCGEDINDIDLATSLEPSKVKERLLKGDIKVFDTGIAYGTVTAILKNKKFEITTLRKDISTDGRHANVQFTSDWQEDASRRDFTINAIYADIDGRIFDPLNGISDLQNGNIKFIGSPTERMQEDYLRILRYLRFFIQYSKMDHDKNVIKAIKQNINGLNKISNERIFDELKKIFSLNNIYSLFLNEQTKEITLNIFPQFKYYQRLSKFNI